MEETQPPFLLLPLFSPFLYEWKIIAYQSPILSLLYLSKILPTRIVTFSIRIFLRSWKRIPKLYLFRKIQNPSFQDYRGNFGKFPFLIEFQGGNRGAGGETELGDVGADQRGEERVYAPGEPVSRRGGRLCPGSAAFALSVACSTPTTPSPRQVSHLQRSSRVCRHGSDSYFGKPPPPLTPPSFRGYTRGILKRNRWGRYFHISATASPLYPIRAYTRALVIDLRPFFRSKDGPSLIGYDRVVSRLFVIRYSLNDAIRRSEGCSNFLESLKMT